jgi:ribosomal protein S18 acetylase RimI-like enzyme
MKIRLAKQTDLKALMDITRRCIINLNAKGIDQWDDAYPSKQAFFDDIQEGSLYVIDSKNGINGCICVNELEYPGYENAVWRGSHFIVVHKMIIDPSFENKGFGKSAMLFAEEIAHEKKKDSIRLDCYKKNPRANNFYKSLEYIVRGEAIFRNRPFYLYEKII